MKLKLSLLLFCLVTLAAAEARADTFVITDTGGALYVETTTSGISPPTARLPPSFLLFGPGLSVSRNIIGSGDAGDVQARDICLNTVCAPGMVLATNSTYSGTLAGLFDGRAVVNGVSYPNVRLTGGLNFISPSIVLPDYVASVTDVTMPFTFTGTITGEALLPDGLVHPIFTATLSGQGLATFRFEEVRRNPADPRYMLSSIEYHFQQTPEPATIILLGTGLAAAAGVARRRRKAARR